MGVEIANEFPGQDGKLSPTTSESAAKVPPELLVPPPRKVYLRPERRAALMLKLIIAILVDLPGIAFLLYAAIDPLFIRYSQPRPATIVDLRVADGNNSKSYHVGYSYVFDGQQRIADEEVEYSLYNSFRLGQKVEVCAARFGPFHYVQLKNGSTVFGRFVLVGLGVAWNMVFFLYLFALALEPRRLVRMGTPTVGRIAEKRSSGRNSTSYCLRYTFQTANGRKKEWPDYVPRKVYERVSVGDQVVVVYKQKSGGSCRSDIYDFSNYAAE